MKRIGNTVLKTSLLGMALLFGSTACFAQADQDTAKDAQSAAAATTREAQHLPLDHGPRSEVTPWVNEQRHLRAQQEK